MRDRRAFLQLVIGAVALRRAPRQQRAPVGGGPGAPRGANTGGHHVYPNQQIQDALEAAARDPVDKTVYVHAGTYRPAAKGQALIWLNARHDGITVEAVGEVPLTAANPQIADAHHPGYPAVVNHVVYFGDGISRRT